MLFVCLVPFNTATLITTRVPYGSVAMKERNTWDTAEARKTGGAGSTTNPLSDGEYRRQMDKLAALNAADARHMDDD